MDDAQGWARRMTAVTRKVSSLLPSLRRQARFLLRSLVLLQGMHMSETSRLRMQDDIAVLAEQGSCLVADLLALAREDWATAELLHETGRPSRRDGYLHGAGSPRFGWGRMTRRSVLRALGRHLPLNQCPAP